jgi:hypothetical protein
MGHEVLVKQLFKTKQLQDLSDLSNFESEISTLMKLVHPNVLSCFGMTSQQNGALFQVYIHTHT